MAWIVGILDKDEEDILKKRGWEIEDIPPKVANLVFETTQRSLKMVWVDNSMLSIMSGPDWDMGEDETE